MLKYSDFIGKRLDDEIKYMPDDVILHIGSRTGFLFVGDKNRYYFDIKKVNSDMIKTQEAIAETAKRKLYCEIRKLIVPGIKDKDAKKCVGKIRVYYDTETASRKYISDFIPLGQRKIIEIYPRLQRDGIVIIVEGAESGKYWDLKEYKKGEA